MANKTLTLTISDKEFTFNLNAEDYNAAIDEIMPGNKIQPAHNFCMRCIADKDKEALAKILDGPSVAWQLWQVITEAYVPDLNIKVGKLSG